LPKYTKHQKLLRTYQIKNSFHPRKISITRSHPLNLAERAKITRLASARPLLGRSTSDKVSGMPSRTQRMASDSPRQVRHRCS